MNYSSKTSAYAQPRDALSSMRWCLIPKVLMLPLMMALSASVPPDVKMISPGVQFNNSAIFFLEDSIVPHLASMRMWMMDYQNLRAWKASWFLNTLGSRGGGCVVRDKPSYPGLQGNENGVFCRFSRACDQFKEISCYLFLFRIRF